MDELGGREGMVIFYMAKKHDIRLKLDIIRVYDHTYYQQKTMKGYDMRETDTHALGGDKGLRYLLKGVESSEKNSSLFRI